MAEFVRDGEEQLAAYGVLHVVTPITSFVSSGMLCQISCRYS
jgi:hypothetical protein